MSGWGEVNARLEYEAEHAVSKQHRADIRAALVEIERLSRDLADIVENDAGQAARAEKAVAEVERLREALEALADAALGVKDLNLPYQSAITLGVKAAIARIVLRGGGEP